MIKQNNQSVLTATTTAPSRLVGIEASRGVAALMVVLFHTTVLMNLPKYFGVLPLHGLFLFGYSGVDFFFVLSGFIILHTHMSDIGKKGAIVNYTRKRFIRVLPIYWVTCTIVLAALAFAPSLRGSFPSTPYIFQSLLLIPQPTMPLIIVAWTLTHELFFYILFGMLIFSPIAGGILMSIWFTGIVFCNMLGFKYNYVTDFIANLHNLEFFLGMGIALACRSCKVIKHSRLIAIIGTVGFISVGILDATALLTAPSLLLIAYALCSSLIIFGLVTHELNHSFSVSAVLRHIGNSSYAIYLIHFTALSFAMKIMVKWNHLHATPSVILFSVLFLTATSCGIFYHILVEIPLLKLIRKYFNNPGILANKYEATLYVK